MTFGSVCSGIEAASVAWEPLGWKAQFLSEIDPAPRAVLQHKYPETKLYGDFTAIRDEASPDVLVGGTPCQSFSIAGLRGGLGDNRGNLALGFCRLADRLRPRWIVWENVPGVLSSNRGRDFGTILGALGEIGYGTAYRILDAQYFGVPQRRRRVFVVGHLGDWRRAAAVLLERESLSGNPPPSRKAGESVTGRLASRTSAGGGLGTDFDCNGGLIASTGHTSHCLNAGAMGRIDYETETLVTHAPRAEGFDASEDGTGRGTPLVAFSCKDTGSDVGDTAPTLRAMGHSGSHANAGGQVAVATNMAVRRLTPLECCRLQGFPDDYFDGVLLRGKPLADGPKYRMLGNSMAVPVMRWIGERIAMVDAITTEGK